MHIQSRWACVFLAVFALGGQAAPAPEAGTLRATAAPSSEPLTPAEFRERIKEVLEAPEFQTEKTKYTWQWRGRLPKRDKERETPTFSEAFLERLGEFFARLAEILEALLWAAALLALILLYAYRDRWLHLVMRTRRRSPEALPLEMFGLDIRRESLPDDIVAAAREAWQRGDAVVALSLLYRGALSQLVHVHQLDVPLSATEDDCLRVVKKTSGTPLSVYFEALTRSWQRIAYGARRPSDSVARALLEQYGAHFGAPCA